MAGLRARLAIGIAVASVGIAAAVGIAVVAAPLVTHPNPFPGQEIYRNPDSTAARASAQISDGDASAIERLAATPAAIWLLPEAHPTGTIAEYVADVATAAASARALPVFVVYGIPDRDCGDQSDGGQSAGGLSAEDYPAWIEAISTGLAGHGAVIVLEPDSLALAPECGNANERVAQLSAAVTELAGAGITIYLDGGHSAWVDVDTMAVLLNAAGIGRVRGFATNVSNFNATAQERDYGERLSALTGGSHFVIDTSRNGNGSDGEWCNPSGAALGDEPSAYSDGSHLDAVLWIKNPGESDGLCNGGPAAGQWWMSGALALVRGT